MHTQNPTWDQCPRRWESQASSRRLVEMCAHGHMSWDTQLLTLVPAPLTSPCCLEDQTDTKEGQARLHLPRGADCWGGPFSGPVPPGCCLFVLNQRALLFRAVLGLWKTEQK